MSVRRATHAGSWYSSSGGQLNDELSHWLSEASSSSHGPAQAIISPHAGYSYCGSCAAYAYRQIDPTNIERVFILGPSHHFYLRDCALSQTTVYKTPLYDLNIDQEIYEELRSTGKFQKMSLRTDEDEHSIEMQLPYVAKVMEKKRGQFTIIPVLVGSLDQQAERDYGKIFSKYMGDPANVFVISSDFCHWGERFRYTYYNSQHGDIYESIKDLDHKGMEIIERLAPDEFSSYLSKYENTICGRHPIGVMLNAAQAFRNGNGTNMQFRFLNYKQSSKCKSKRDSSVSYAAGSLVFQ